MLFFFLLLKEHVTTFAMVQAGFGYVLAPSLKGLPSFKQFQFN
jgi:hypothetical protein